MRFRLVNRPVLARIGAMHVSRFKTDETVPNYVQEIPLKTSNSRTFTTMLTINIRLGETAGTASNFWLGMFPIVVPCQPAPSWNMACDERERLALALRVAGVAYAQSLKSIENSSAPRSSSEYKTLKKRFNEARAQVQKAGSDLDSHAAAHGC